MRIILFSLMVSSIFFFTVTEPAQALSSKKLAALCESYVENNFTGSSSSDYACVSYFLGVIDTSNTACTILGIRESTASDDYTKLQLQLSKNSLGSVASSADVDKIIKDFLTWFKQNPTLSNLPPTVGTKDWLTAKWGCN